MTMPLISLVALTSFPQGKLSQYVTEGLRSRRGEASFVHLLQGEAARRADKC